MPLDNLWDWAQQFIFFCSQIQFSRQIKSAFTLNVVNAKATSSTALKSCSFASVVDISVCKVFLILVFPQLCNWNFISMNVQNVTIRWENFAKYVFPNSTFRKNFKSFKIFLECLIYLACLLRNYILSLSNFTEVHVLRNLNIG